MKPPPSRHGIEAYPEVLNARGHVRIHAYEPPHDDPAGGPCWFCLLPEGAPVHRPGARHALSLRAETRGRVARRGR